jgi:hypothetical protein
MENRFKMRTKSKKNVLEMTKFLAEKNFNGKTNTVKTETDQNSKLLSMFET